jgi:hypothetical protein
MLIEMPHRTWPPVERHVGEKCDRFVDGAVAYSAQFFECYDGLSDYPFVLLHEYLVR